MNKIELTKRTLIVAIAVLAGNQMLLAQFRPAPPQQARPVPQNLLRPSPQTNRPLWQVQQSQTVPSDAYRRMDTRSQVDPRILEAQRRAQEQEQAKRQFDEVKKRYSTTLQQQIRSSHQPGNGPALQDAAQYFAMAESDGKEKAVAWRNQRRSVLETELQRLKSQVLPKATAHDTVIAGAAALAGTTGGGSMSKQTEQLISATEQHLNQFNALTVDNQPPRFMPGH